MDINVLLPTVKGAFENSIFTKVNSLGLGIDNATLRAIVSRVSEEVATYSIGIVSQKSNQSLTDIPNNRIGINNPVNITTQNNNATSITNNFWGLIDVQVNTLITGKISSALERELKNSLPNGSKIINYSALAATVVQSLVPTVSSVVNSVVKSFATSLFTTGVTVPTTITGKGLESSIQKLASNPSSALSGLLNGAGSDGGLATMFGLDNAVGAALYKDIDKFNIISGLDTALEPINKQYAQTQAGAALSASKNFDINNTDNQQKIETTSKGFNDPEGVYPTKEYAGKSDTNKLAQGDARGTVVLNKNEGRMLGARLPFGGSWDEPESAYNAQYPYNKVTQTESGHIIEIDDTPGNERLHLFHKSGTYIEIDVNGSVVKRTKGSSYEIIDRNGKIAINGRADISINGACNIYVGNDANLEVEGDVNVKCHNDVTVQAGGTLNLGATEEINIASKNINFQAHENFNIMADVDLNLHAGANYNLLSNASVYVQATNAYETYTSTHMSANVAHMKMSESLYVETTTDTNIKAGGKVNVNGDSDINILSGASLNADGSAMYINSGNATGAESAEDSAGASIAGTSNLGLLDGRKDTIYFEIDDPSPLTLADGISIHVETDNHTDTKEMRRTQRETVLASGVCSPDEYDKTPVATDRDSPVCNQRTHVAANSELKRMTAIPGNYNLSPHFTLDMVTTKAAVSGNPLQSNRGLTYGEIAYNLQGLALNVLEPIKKLYPNMFVTSAFRPDPSGTNPSSQHGLGQAADIQFRGASKSDYYEIARKIASVVNYDQLLLEYRTSANNPWLHISYSGNQNRNMVLTLNNDTTYAQGLVNLA